MMVSIAMIISDVVVSHMVITDIVRSIHDWAIVTVMMVDMMRRIIHHTLDHCRL